MGVRLRSPLQVGLMPFADIAKFTVRNKSHSRKRLVSKHPYLFPPAILRLTSVHTRLRTRVTIPVVARRFFP